MREIPSEISSPTSLTTNEPKNDDTFFRYEKTLSDCQECYAMQRRTLLTSRCEEKLFDLDLAEESISIEFSVQSAIQDLANKNERDMCTLVSISSLDNRRVRRQSHHNRLGP